MKPRRSHNASLSCRNARARFVRRTGSVVAAAAVSLLLCGPMLAQDDAAGDEPAIPPGQEDLLLEMLGPGAALPDCELTDGQINFTVIKLTYACPGGEVEYELAHRSKAGRGSTPTDRFAITLTSGTPPRGFADALVSIVRAREAEFEWVLPSADDRAQ